MAATLPQPLSGIFTVKDTKKEASHLSRFPTFLQAEVEGFEPPLAVLETAVLALRRHLYM